MKKYELIAPSVLLASAMLTVSGAAMAQDEDEGDVIVIRGANIPDEKKATAEISNVLDAEDLVRQGDSDIADALRRVTGLSIEGGKFVIVRGLNSRYNNATLNGSPLPSPEPLKRTAPLDLFPTSVLEGTLVQKTFSPQFSGEFGGGIVELRSRSVPDEDFLEVGVDFGFNTETTLRDGLFYEGSDTDVFGFDDGLRDLPSEVVDFIAANPTQRDLSVEARTSFEQFDTLLINSDDTPANGGGSVAFGKLFETGRDFSIGTTFYAGYDNDWITRNGFRNRPETFDGTNYIAPDEDFSNYLSTTQEITVSALSSSGIEWDAHAVDFTALLVRKSSKEAQIATGKRDQGNDYFRDEATNFVERQIWQTQLTGEHEFDALADLQVDWRFAYGEGERDSPYDRQTSYRTFPPGTPASGDVPYVFRNNSALNYVNFGKIDDVTGSTGADFMLPLTLADRNVDFSFGAAYSVNSREASRTDFVFAGIYPNEVLGSRIDLILSDEILSLPSPVVRLQSTSNQPDLFSGLMQVTGAYAAADMELGDFFRLSIGGRYEESKQKTETDVSVQTDGRQLFPTLQEDFFLPAATLTWIPAGNFQLRAGYSETITRPQFRELTSVRFNDPETDVVYAGNPFLQNSSLKNYDARAEWYFNRGEFATVGVFFKEIENPIEDFFSTQGEASVLSFFNAPSAELWGAELEFEKNFALEDYLGDAWGGSDLVFKTNYTWSDSEVDNSGTVTRALFSSQGTTAQEVPTNAFVADGSRLVGQSEHLFNLQLGLEDANSGFQGTFLVNYASERTLYRGEGSQPSVVETPPVTLDLVINQDLDILGGDVSLGVKLQNITNSGYNATISDEIQELDFEAYDIGRSFSVSLNKAF
ncbi:TonB-dependent receptor domain-containing protein [Aquisalinus flavus]|uniref:TonB-dependent receptor n=1 Tax=Aquisalinus flavus TaxID=1526572 RepID=A0A8J2V2A0_9PROT|nr:TonB-dependent receptor [Aquisalinus flavus]MBD0427317.1 TonB-dependent receptor [Aquisalinus flavus]GGD00038.1 TonB-dependent receptor [Aquisalinus flavus]